MWNKHKWKKGLAFIMSVSLMSGFASGGTVYAKTAEPVQEQAVPEPEEPENRAEGQERTEGGEIGKQEEPEKTPQETVLEQEPAAEGQKEQQPADAQEQEPGTQEPEAPAEGSGAGTEEVRLEGQMQIAQLNRLAARGAAAENETVSVKIYNNDVVTDGTIHTGYIADNIRQDIEGSHFVGAYVVTETGEDEITYVGSYTVDGVTYVYYGLSSDSSTGMLLREGQYIKLVYKTTCSIKYEVRLEDGTEVNDGGTFYDKRDGIDYGTDLRIQFKANQNEGADYFLVSVKAAGADGKETEIKTDNDGYGYLNNVRQNVTVTARVRKIEQYKLVVDRAENGHVCWAGHGDETNANTKNPYSVKPEQFCSYRASDGATVTAKPGGTIYFVLYSQAWSSGGVWEFNKLAINGKPLDMVYDGEAYKTDIGNGMTAYIRYLGPGKDSHLKRRGLFDNPAETERCKYECWVDNVHEDIHVEFDNADMKNHEIVRLAEKEGIEEVCASTFDRRMVGGDYLNLGKNNVTRLLPKAGVYDFWRGLYSPASTVGADISNVTYTGNTVAPTLTGLPIALADPDAPYAQSYWGLTASTWNCWYFSDHAHLEVQSNVFKDSADADANKQTLQWGSRFVYFKTLPGYDPRTLNAQITGKGADGNGRTRVEEIGNIYDLTSEAISTAVYRANNNASLYYARQKGYMWYLRYIGEGINVRNLYLNCNPYQYGVEYDLNGGTIDGSGTYEDSGKYTIESGKNRISLPSRTPHKDGYVFSGWKLTEVTPVNVEELDKEEYDPLKGVKTDYNANDVFTINSGNYEAGLETERSVYKIEVVDSDKNNGSNGEANESGTLITKEQIDYIPVQNGNHRFRFVAQWTDENDPSMEKAEYTVKVYTETAPGTEGAVEAGGKAYTVAEENHLGIKGEDIISIHRTPEGYILNKDKSVVILRNFLKDGNTDREIAYYFDKPQWGISQTSDPEGGESANGAAKVKIKDEIRYTLKVENKENETALLPAGTVITAVLPKGMETPVNRGSLGLTYAYQADTRTVSYTLDAPREMKAGESLELKYSATVAESGLMESMAALSAEWKKYESEKIYHVTCADLTISNTLRGDYADYTKEFEVTVALTGSDGKPLADKTIGYKGGKLGVQGANQAPAGGSLTLNAANEIKFKLKHGQSITLKDLPYGCNYKVVQKDESGYVTAYEGVNMTGDYWNGTNLPVAADLWPSADWFPDPYEQVTLYPGMVFEYDGKYFAVSRKFSLNREQAELGPEGKGPDGQTNGWFGVTKLTGRILEMEDGAENTAGLGPVTRGDVIKYKGEYYLFNTGGEIGCNPEKDTGTPPHYHNLSGAGVSGGLMGDQSIGITNTYEKVSPTGITGGNSSLFAACLAIALMGCAVTGCGVRYRKSKKGI